MFYCSVGLTPNTLRGYKTFYIYTNNICVQGFGLCYTLRLRGLMSDYGCEVPRRFVFTSRQLHVGPHNFVRCFINLNNAALIGFLMRTLQYRLLFIYTILPSDSVLLISMHRIYDLTHSICMPRVFRKHSVRE